MAKCYSGRGDVGGPIYNGIQNALHVQKAYWDLKLRRDPLRLTDKGTCKLGNSDRKHGGVSSVDEIACNMAKDGIPIPIAIVGMGMRLPGGVKSAEDFWEMLINKRDGLCETPETRYNVQSFYNESQPRSVKTRKGYYLPEYLGKADTAFLSTQNSEVSKLDPQQILLMEVIWDCMENAGQVDWRGKDIGCYIGVFGGDWRELQSKDSQRVDRSWPLTTGDFGLSNGISYRYDLRGPSVTVETACSSSLAALHYACLSIYNEDCESSIVGGSSLILTPTMTAAMSDNMILSPDGICKTFDASADGFGRGEAVNAIYIKRLDAAIRDNDPIRAVICGSAANCDGRTASIASPSQESQVELIRKAYKQAGIQDVYETAFFECHGTGTAVGDAVEAAAVAEVFGEKGIIIGSVKPNVGHGEGASGINSIIKAVLSLEHRVIPPNIHFNTPSPQIPFERAKLQVPLEPLPWPEDRVGRVSVNSFGIGGSNIHVILDSMTKSTVARGDLGSNRQPSPKVLVVSSKSERGLDQYIEAVIEYLERNPHSICDLAYTLSLRRDHLNHRAFVVTGGEEKIEPALFQRFTLKHQKSPMFLFTGQAAQWPGMGAGLIANFPIFKTTIQRLDQALKKLDDAPEWSIEEILTTADPSLLGRADASQTACTALQIGLVALLGEWGIHPTSVTGHSSGEIAAAYAANAITADSAIIIAYYRGKTVMCYKSTGGMLAVGRSRQDVTPFLIDGVSIGCENSPQSVTLTGDKDKLQVVLDGLLAEMPGTLHKFLAVNIAYHSDYMKDIGTNYESLIQPHIKMNKMTVSMYSTLTGKLISNSEDVDAKYWRESLESPVLFLTAVKAMVNERDNTDLFFIEVGPHSALSGPLRQIMNEIHRDFTYCPTVARQKDQLRSLLNAFGHAYLNDIPVDFRIANGNGNTLKDIPLRFWQNDDLGWVEDRLTRNWRFRQFPHHELLGSRTLESSDIEPAWRNVFYVRDNAWVSQHKILNDIVFPGAGYIAMAVEAIRQITGYPDCSLKHVHWKTALVMQLTSEVELLTSFRPLKLTDSVDSVWYEFTISSYASGRWTKHCAGQARPGPDQPQLYRAATPFTRLVSPDSWYRKVRECGLEYGPRFRLLSNITVSPTENTATAVIADDPDLCGTNYAVHPVVIDQCLQLFGIAACRGLMYQVDEVAVPLFVDKAYVSSGASSMSLIASMTDPSEGERKGSCTLTVNDNVALSMEGAIFFTMKDQSHVEGLKMPIVSQLEWRPSVDFLPLSSLLQSNLETGPLFQNISKRVLLAIIEASYRLHPCHSEEEYLVKYKKWVETEFIRIQEGAYSFIPEAKDWTMMDRETRMMIYDTTMSEGIISPVYEEVIHKTWEIYDDLYAGNSTIFLDYVMEGDKLKEFYGFSTSHVGWKDFLSSVGNLNPQMRVLEIGAGTCAATMRVLECLQSSSGTPLFSSYAVTDISPAFLQAARSTLTEAKNIEYFVLDISQDPLKQGFESESFDLIIASNVLHATPSLSATLRNVHRLLAPGGYLLLHELCSTIPYVNIIMGLFPGWWLGEDDGRGREPFVSPDRWDQELRNTGFSGVAGLAYDSPPPYQITATMISMKCNTYPSERRVAMVAYGDIQSNPWVQVVEQKLRQKGYDVQWPAFGEDMSVHPDVISLVDVNEDDYTRFRELLTSSKNILWVTKSVQMKCDDPRYGAVLGVARTARAEELVNFETLEVDKFNDASADALLKVFEKFRQQRTVKDSDSRDREFALSDGTIYVGRYHWRPIDAFLRIPTLDTHPRTLDIASYGVLDTLRWVQKRIGPLKSDEVEVNMKYIALNFKDIMVALGVVTTDRELGIEGSGIVTKVGSHVQGLHVGDSVLVIHPGVFGTTITIPAAHCMPVPKGLTLESGAGMPSVYATAIYSLVVVGKLEKHQSVLIHCACGGVGLAAIAVCKKIGAEIYTTVGNEEKVQYLVDTVGIPRNRIFNSRDSSFVTDILRETSGRGVDIVLDSLSGDLLRASWKVVARMGKMIEIGKRDFIEHGKLDMEMFQILEKVVEFSQQGDLQQTLPVTIFDATEVSKAFRHMQKGIHIGKILVRMPEDPGTLPTASDQVHVSFRPDSYYLLVGGMGGLGRSVASWMVLNGARRLIFLSRSAGESDSDRAFLRELEDQGCVATAVAGDVTKLEDVERAASLGRVAGVIQMAVVLRDQLFPVLAYEDWNAVLSPKVTGTWNLHRTFSNADLDFFLMFGSLSGWRGNRGQANYAAANTFLDSFAQYRRRLGLPASLIALGPVEGIGQVSKDARLLKALHSRSIYLLSERDVFDAIKIALTHKHAHPSDSCLVSEELGFGLVSHRPKYELELSGHLGKDRRFGMYLNLESSTPQKPEIASDSVLQELASSVKNDPTLLDQDEFKDKICREMGKQVSMYTSNAEDLSNEELANLHIDSLMSLEIRYYLKRHLSVEVSLMEISNVGTVRELSNVIVKTLKAKYQTPKEIEDAPAE
ncbi:polyketide synthase [Aspergillus sclerotialis]|uniref:Polyketide synthase n=1 Tax=Aspergillus sclerotialis TaxID=2070753 RepID=A0A3A2ZV73_9EURO|nr:polyketide synthase [Aspergillus sclerotialis]